jgi:hypothetical protein
MQKNILSQMQQNILLSRVFSMDQTLSHASYVSIFEKALVTREKKRVRVSLPSDEISSKSSEQKGGRKLGGGQPFNEYFICLQTCLLTS